MKPRVFLPSILSGVLLWTAFFPLDLGLTAFVALAPFLTLVRADGVTRRRRYLAAFAGGFTFFALAINWVRVAHPAMMFFTWPAGSIYCGLYWPMALALLRALDRLKLPFSVTLPVVWVGLEYVRAHFPTGFPFLEPLGVYQLIGFHWYSLGYAAHRLTPFIQAADLGGVYLLSFVIASLNGSAYGWMMRSVWVRRLFRWPALPPTRTFIWEAYDTAWTSILPVVVLCYGVVQLGHPPYPAGPRVAAVQGNVPQNEKMKPGDPTKPDAVSPLQREYYPLAQAAARPTDGVPKPDLVVWPETCFPVEWLQVSPRLSPDAPETAALRAEIVTYERRFAAHLRDYFAPTHVLLGLNRQEMLGPETDGDKFNAAILVDPEGRLLGGYDKMHLVPFGEYVPLKSSWLQAFTPYKTDYSCTPGTRWTVFEVPAAAQPGRTFKFGVLICYEDGDPYLARQYNSGSGRGHDADFLVNISNDGWFTGTEEHEQHLAICRFRAIEARRAVVRSVNTGISAIIDPDGKLVALPDLSDWSKGKATTAIVRGEVPIETRSTVYAALGDWVPTLCWVAITAGLVATRLRKSSAPPQAR